MKKITYACSLCRTEFRGNASDNLIGWYWKTTHPSGSPCKEVMDIRDISQVEHHLCKKCLVQIAESGMILRAKQ